MRRALAVVVLLLGAGCDDDTDLTGVYEITSNVASSPCGADADVMNGPAFLSFRKSELFGTSYFVYDECKDLAATDCLSSGGLFEGLFEPIDSGWLGRSSSTSRSGTFCVLSYDEETAKLNGSHLVVEHTTYSDAGDLPEDQCTTDEAEKRGKKMGCADHSRIEAEKR